MRSVNAQFVDANQFGSDLNQITMSPARVIGSAGYYAAGDYLQHEIEKLPNVELKRHEFPVMVPVTESATIDLGDGRVERIYPFWPAQVRICATPIEGISGNLVYAGECRYEQLRPKSIKGQIAVVEASAGGNWVQAFYFGARAVLILGKPETTWVDLQEHDLRIPINLPRFYVPPGKLNDELRAGSIASATLKASVTWQRKMAQIITRWCARRSASPMVGRNPSHPRR